MQINGQQLDFPFEAIERQLDVSSIERFAEGQTVQLISDAETFRHAFGRFAGDKLNGWSYAKDQLRGQAGVIVEVFDDDTVTISFQGRRFDFPFEALVRPWAMPTVVGQFSAQPIAVQTVPQQQTFAVQTYPPQQQPVPAVATAAVPMAAAVPVADSVPMATAVPCTEEVNKGTML